MSNPGTTLAAAVSATLFAHLKDHNDRIILATVSGGAPPATANLFARGAIVIRLDGSSGTAVYKNDGTAASPSFTLIDSVAASEIAIAEALILVGNAGGVGAAVAVSGDATISAAGALTIAAGAVTLAKMANLATDTFVGRDTAGTGVPEAISAAAALTMLGAVAGVAAGYKVARGVESVTGSATVVTGLATVVSVQATPASDLDGDTLAGVSATKGDQAGSPAAGSVILKAWKVTTGGAAGNPTLIAADAAKDVNWFAIGT